VGCAIYKPDPELDEYLIFSINVDAPVSPVMNREEIFEEWRTLCEQLHGAHLSPEAVEKSLARADAKGQSWYGTGSFWEEEELVSVVNMRPDAPIEKAWCKHRDLAKLTRAVAAGDWDRVRELVTESETEEEWE